MYTWLVVLLSVLGWQLLCFVLLVIVDNSGKHSPESYLPFLVCFIYVPVMLLVTPYVRWTDYTLDIKYFQKRGISRWLYLLSPKMARERAALWVFPKDKR